MNKNIIYLFSGQGSQYHHMAKELFRKNAIFRKWMLALDELASSLMGKSVIDNLYHGEKTERDIFNQLLYTHPAIFMVEYSLSQVFTEMDINPDYVVGTSLGEFASATVAGVMSPYQALEIVIKQAQCVNAYAPPGGMVAIIDKADLYRETPQLKENSEIASINFDTHFVVSAKARQTHDIEAYLKQQRILHQTLPVTYGFHSSCIDPAASAFTAFLRSQSFKPPRTNLFSGVLGTRLETISADYFWDVIRRPVNFPEVFRELEQKGNNVYLDLGPGGTLANFAKRNRDGNSKSESFGIITPFHQELKNLEKIKTINEIKIQVSE